MTDLHLADKWVKETRAGEAISDKRQLKKVSLSLLRAWRRYKKTGRCPWTGADLYDYTHFLHAFADRYAGSDDDLYHWLTDSGLKMLDIMQQRESGAQPAKFCPICGRRLTQATSGQGPKGKAWCNSCAINAKLKNIIGP